VAAGEDADRLAEPDLVRHPGRWVVGAHGVGAREVEDRLHHDGGVGEPGLEEVGGQDAEPFDGDRGGVRVEVVQGGPVEMQEQGGRRGSLGRGVGTGEEVEGALRVGQDAGGAGTSYLERVGVAQGLQGPRTAGDRGVERLGVGGVESHRDLGGGGSGAPSEDDLAGSEGTLLIVDGAVGVVVEPRLVDEVLDALPREPGRVVAGQEPVGVRCRLGGQIVVCSAA
jgi:hypothetical protein